MFFCSKCCNFEPSFAETRNIRVTALVKVVPILAYVTGRARMYAGTPAKKQISKSGYKYIFYLK